MVYVAAPSRPAGEVRRGIPPLTVADVTDTPMVAAPFFTVNVTVPWLTVVELPTVAESGTV
jgi:hypothetical protein